MSLDYNISLTIMCMNCNDPIGMRMVNESMDRPEFHVWEHLRCPHCNNIIWLKLDREKNV